MKRYVITLNAGSSSIKFALFAVDGAALTAIAVGLAEMLAEERRIKVHDGAGKVTHEESWQAGSGVPFHTNALRRILAWRQAAFPEANVVAAGHRVVHGGLHYDVPVLVTD
jgi:acetate kinase